MSFNTLDQKHLLYDCLLLLEKALEKSKFNFYFKIVMIRIYLELNAYDKAVALYESLEIKQVQHESLS
jgi:N-terminal acetyltransferase B complex non-catalytic subunit